MSVIIKHIETDSYILYTKGADTEMFKKSSQTDHEHFETALKEYSIQGWRTLVFGYKILTNDQFEFYLKILNDARNDILKREERLNEAFDIIESELIMSGVTAVEDKLQEQVAETIQSLREAGIKIWVLTGDKLETAVNISESCRHFTDSMTNFILADMRSSNELKETLKNIYQEIKSLPSESFALVVDGETLGFIFEMNYQENFREIAVKCDAVLCCRMSPSQKAMVRIFFKVKTFGPIVCHGIIDLGQN